MERNARVTCTECECSYRLSEYLQDGTERLPMLWAADGASSSEEALKSAKCLDCKEGKMSPLWNVLEEQGEELGKPPWASRRKKSKGRGGKRDARRSSGSPSRPSVHKQSSSVRSSPVMSNMGGKLVPSIVESRSTGRSRPARPDSDRRSQQSRPSRSFSSQSTGRSRPSRSVSDHRSQPSLVSRPSRWDNEPIVSTAQIAHSMRSANPSESHRSQSKGPLATLSDLPGASEAVAAIKEREAKERALVAKWRSSGISSLVPDEAENVKSVYWDDATLVLDEVGKPIFCSVGDFEKVKSRKVESPRGGLPVRKSIVIDVVALKIADDEGSEEHAQVAPLAVDMHAFYRAYQDQYPVDTPTLEEAPGAGGQSRRNTWMPERGSEDVLLYNDSGQPVVIHAGEKITKVYHNRELPEQTVTVAHTGVTVSEQKKQTVEDMYFVLPSGAQIRTWWSEDGNDWYTCGELMWALLARALREELSSEEGAPSWYDPDAVDAHLASHLRKAGSIHLMNRLIGVMWLLSATKSEISRRNSELRRLDRRKKERALKRAEKTKQISI